MWQFAHSDWDESQSVSGVDAHNKPENLDAPVAGMGPQLRAQVVLYGDEEHEVALKSM